MSDKVQVYQDDSGEWRWRRTASNGEVIADSGEGYVHREHAVKMARQVNGSEPLYDFTE
jgi:uncharacterized protein YegP (UPF0339 family)